MLMSILVQIIGLLFLSLSLDKHFKSLFEKVLNPILGSSLKLLGWSLIGISIVLLGVFGDPLSVSIVYWLAVLSINILLLAVLYSLLSSRKRT